MKNINDHMSIAVVIPMFNEEKTISKVLEALVSQTYAPTVICVVDNVSSDRSRDLVHKYQKKYPHIDLIYEKNKGTGHASAAGFKYVSDKYNTDIICRTDADTIVCDEWIEAIEKYFTDNKQKIILTGKGKPLHDGFYLWYDSLIYNPYWLIMRSLSAMRSRQLLWLKLTPGHNLAIKRKSYLEVGGFDRGAIDKLDEDITLYLKICNKYGMRAVGYSRKMVVHTSLRRIRKIGYFKLMSYYLKKPDSVLRNELSQGNVDIR
jgi:glycosyltransferase involved in cell wall biosynthesis